MVLFSPLVGVPSVGGVRAVGPTWDRTYLPVILGTSSVDQTNDDGFIMSAESRGLWVMKTNPAGMPEWQEEYTPVGYSICCGGATTVVEQTSDGGYIVTGAVLSAGYVTGFDGWLLKLDKRGG